MALEAAALETGLSWVKCTRHLAHPAPFFIALRDFPVRDGEGPERDRRVRLSHTGTGTKQTDTGPEHTGTGLGYTGTGLEHTGTGAEHTGTGAEQNGIRK